MGRHFFRLTFSVLAVTLITSRCGSSDHNPDSRPSTPTPSSQPPSSTSNTSDSTQTDTQSSDQNKGLLDNTLWSMGIEMTAPSPNRRALIYGMNFLPGGRYHNFVALVTSSGPGTPYTLRMMAAKGTYTLSDEKLSFSRTSTTCPKRNPGNLVGKLTDADTLVIKRDANALILKRTKMSPTPPSAVAQLGCINEDGSFEPHEWSDQ